MTELLTQLQDEVFKISSKFRDCVGMLQQLAPPQAVATEALLAKAPNPDIDVQQLVQSYTKDIIELTKTVDSLCQLLPDNLQHPASGDLRHKQNFEAEVRQLQQQHQQVTDELAAAVEEVEGLLQQLQQLYAALAQAKLQGLSGSNQTIAGKH